MKHILVTGAAGGIGRAVATTFASDGWAVTGVDLRALEPHDPFTNYGPNNSFVIADLADPVLPGLAVEEAWQRTGPLDAIVNAAGIYPSRGFLDLEVDLWDRVQAVNLRAAMLTTRAFAALSIGAGRIGCVVNISSGAALRARPGAAHYSISKAALEMLTKASAIELGSSGIRVNAVRPGFVTVDSVANPVTEEYAAAASVNPLGRRGRPSDVAAAVMWLVSPASAWVTGIVLGVDGGASAGTTTLPHHWPKVTDIQGTATHFRIDDASQSAGAPARVRNRRYNGGAVL